MLDPSIATIVGGCIAFIGGLTGGLGGAALTGRQARIDRESASAKEIVRLMPKVRHLVEYEMSPPAAFHVKDTPEKRQNDVDDVLDQIQAFSRDYRSRRDRGRLDVCVEAIRDRYSMGPDVKVEIERAMRTMRGIEQHRANGRWWQRLDKGSRQSLDHFITMQEISEDNRAENHAAMVEYQETLRRKARGAKLDKRRAERASPSSRADGASE